MRRSIELLAIFAVAVGAARPSTHRREATAVLAGGCFWGVQWVYEHVKGVVSVESGYAGGTTVQPSYRQVNTGATGHAETVRIVYDPDVVSYRQLLEVFFLVAHDPTSRDRQGPDVGSDYRAIVFAQDSAQHRDVTAYIAELTAQRRFREPIVTDVRGAEPFYRAEAYHQHYAAEHPGDLYILVNDVPKLTRLQRVFPQLYRP
jgi:peptide-methionine (S)-S-oxide reductase